MRRCVFLQAMSFPKCFTHYKIVAVFLAVCINLHFCGGGWDPIQIGDNISSSCSYIPNKSEGNLLMIIEQCFSTKALKNRAEAFHASHTVRPHRGLWRCSCPPRAWRSGLDDQRVHATYMVDWGLSNNSEWSQKTFQRIKLQNRLIEGHKMKNKYSKVDTNIFVCEI